MEKMKLNIQLFAITKRTTFTEIPLTDNDIVNNYSSLKVTVYFDAGNNVTWFSSKPLYIAVNGVLQSKNVSLSKGGSVTATFTYNNIPHNADGTKSVNWDWHINTGTSALGNLADIGTRTLQTIPRASEPSLSSSSINLGSSVTISTNRVSESFTHTISYSFGSASGVIAENVNTSTSWTPPLNLAFQIPSSTSGTCTITCTTYNGSTLVGTKSINLTLNVPSDIKPSVTFSSVSEAGDVPSSWGIYVKTKSRVALSLSASGIYGSSISSYSISYYGGAVATNSFTTSYLTSAGSTTFTGQVTDTRKRTNSTTTTINVVDYYNPTISTAQVQRCDGNGNIDNNGEYMYISYGASISSCSNKNTPSSAYKVRYRIKDTGSYTEIQLASNVNSYSASGMLFTDGIKAASSSGTKVQFSSSNTYDIQFYVKDYFMEYTNLQSLDTGFDLMNFNASGKAMAIGKVSEAGANEELFEVGMDTEIEGNLDVDGKTESSGEVIGGLSNSYGQLRAVYGNRGFFIRNDGSNTYFMLTDDVDAYGIWNSLRPIIIDNNNGYVTLGNGAGTNGNFTANDGNLEATKSGTWVSIAPQNNMFCHYQTGASAGHYFNKNIYVLGDVYAGSNYNRLLAYQDSVPRIAKVGWGNSMSFYLGDAGQALVMLNHDQMALLWSVSGGTSINKTNILGSSIVATISNSQVTIKLSNGESFSGFAILSP